MNTKDLAIDLKELRLRVLVYGNSGTGKTTFAGTFSKPYFFDFNQGMLSLRGQDIAYDTYVDENLRRPNAYQNFLGKVRELKAGKKEFETMVIDDAPSMCNCVMRHIQMLNGTLDKTPNLHEWQQLVRKVYEAFYDFKLLNYNVVMVALESISKNELSGELKNQPLLLGKALTENAPSWFDEVYRAQVDRGKEGEVEYRILTTSARRYIAKSRLNGKLRCFDEMEIPDYKRLMSKVKKAV